MSDSVILPQGKLNPSNMLEDPPLGDLEPAAETGKDEL